MPIQSGKKRSAICLLALLDTKNIPNRSCSIIYKALSGAIILFTISLPYCYLRINIFFFIYV